MRRVISAGLLAQSSVEVYDGNGDDLGLCRLTFISVERRQKSERLACE